MEERLLSKKDVCAMCAFSPASLDRYVKDETFPLPRRFGFRVFWRLSEVQAWIHALFADGDSAD